MPDTPFRFLDALKSLRHLRQALEQVGLWTAFAELAMRGRNQHKVATLRVAPSE